MHRVTAVGFDLDGTLFDHRTASRAGATGLLAGLGVDVTPAVLDAWTAAEDAQYEHWRAGRVSFAEQRRTRLRTVLPPLGIEPPPDDGGLDALFGRYLAAYREAWTLFPDAIPVLDELRGEGYRIGLLTNGAGEQQRDKLAATGLDAAFDAVCVSEEIGVAKPDPRAFGLLLAALDVTANACVFVGDDAAKDVAGARAAGMRAAAVDRPRVGLREAVREALAT
ncbi:HAD family hydrolase [Curtobacterium sp. MCBA15_001]|uniref:HAD family hydrolase n=1 Tax=Curtobacterium sp. MCBA15_001 TaxID=1898731 RepID=UPI0008DDF3C1|nr:HAD family hydrolase [Curtobacterium sp. MCBA15_001]OIH94674.1 hypothetical protein BIU90_05135 [Curtobacterium sp. MCBA15_001]